VILVVRIANNLLANRRKIVMSHVRLINAPPNVRTPSSTTQANAVQKYVTMPVQKTVKLLAAGVNLTAVTKNVQIHAVMTAKTQIAPTRRTVISLVKKIVALKNARILSTTTTLSAALRCVSSTHVLKSARILDAFPKLSAVKRHVAIHAVLSANNLLAQRRSPAQMIVMKTHAQINARLLITTMRASAVQRFAS
jgi:hypothetical protein